MSRVKFIDLQAQRRRLGGRIEKAILGVLDHGQFIIGPEVAELETRIAEFAEVRHVVSCANGTDALILALRALGVQPGQGVIVPSFTFCATAEAVALVGAVPIFADVQEDTFNLDPRSVFQAIRRSEVTPINIVGIIAVDLFGLPADYVELGEVAEEEGLWIIADAAQSFGASFHGRRVGSLASVTTTSFFPSKPLGCFGDGGAVLTDDDRLAETIDSLRLHGRGASKYDNVRIGRNSRLDTLQAAILLEKLTVFEEELNQRQCVAERYKRELDKSVRSPAVCDGCISAWAHYTIVVDASKRDALMEGLQQKGIPTSIYYPLPLHHQSAYIHYPRAHDELPVSEALCETVLSLPMHPYLSTDDQAEIINAINGMISQTTCSSTG